jgi:hypothetical protein
MKNLFEEKLGITFDSKETVLELNGCVIEAFPSNHLDAFRSLTNPKFILLDEADFFRKSEQEDVRHVSERYIAKSDPFIVMVSTPYAPDGLFDSIEKEPDEMCIYKRIFMDYTYGLNKIYTTEEVEKAKVSPSFEREYNLKYLGGIGNVFHTKDFDAAIEKGKLYNPTIPNTYAKKCMGIDPAYGSSSFGIVVTQFVDGQIQIVHAEEYKRPDFNEMLESVWDLLVKYNVQKIYIDGANPSFIKGLKIQWGERADYENVKKEHRQYMKVEPVNFNQEHKEMLGQCKLYLEKGHIAINPIFDKLVISLRTAVAEENILHKESTSYADIFDAYRLTLKHYQLKPREIEDEDIKKKKANQTQTQILS